MTMENTHLTLEHVLKYHKDVQRPRSHGQIVVQCDETGNGQRIFSKTFKIRFTKTWRWNGLPNSRKCFPMDIKKSQQNKGFNKIVMTHNLWAIKYGFYFRWWFLDRIHITDRTKLMDYRFLCCDQLHHHQVWKTCSKNLFKMKMFHHSHVFQITAISVHGPTKVFSCSMQFWQV